MAVIDPEQERQRLRAEYSRMLDGELEKIAADFDDLTLPAQSALQDELSRRGISVETSTAGGQLDVLNQYMDDSTSVDVQGNLCAVRRFLTLSEAMIAQSKLRSAGIDSLIAEQHMLTTNPHLLHAIGGARLMVDAEEAAAASEILNDPIPSHIEIDGLGTYVQPRCPQCFSLQISFGETDGAALATGLPVLLPDETWRCQVCGCRWQDSEDFNS